MGIPIHMLFYYYSGVSRYVRLDEGAGFRCIQRNSGAIARHIYSATHLRRFRIEAAQRSSIGLSGGHDQRMLRKLLYRK